VWVFHNAPEPIFRMERKGLEEFHLKIPPISVDETGAEEAWCWKYRVRELMDVRGYEKVMFLDADCLALRNVDHLFSGDWDICVKPEPGLKMTQPKFGCFLTNDEIAGPRKVRHLGINSGTLTVRADIFHDVMAEWERIDQGPTTRRRYCSDQGSWNRLVLDCGGVRGVEGAKGGDGNTNDPEYGGTQRKTSDGAPMETSGNERGPRLPWRVAAYDRGEVQFPLFLDHDWKQWQEAAILHCLGGDSRQKLKFMLGAWTSAFLYDDNGILINMLEM
jgi:hypothetical protein